MKVEELREAVVYDPESGVFRWKNHRCSNLVGMVCGNLHHSGYVRISIKKKSYLAHRLAWFYTHGAWPDEIDHANGIRNDNRFSNLREASRSLNLANRAKRPWNSSGYKGVIQNKQSKRWIALVTVGGKQKHVGTFDDPKEAHAAYCQAATKLYGEFAKFE